MYNGGLITFHLKNKDSLLAISLFDIAAEITEDGLLLKNNKTNKEIGYFLSVTGIQFEEMMRFLGYEYNI